MSAKSGHDFFKRSLAFCGWTGIAAVILFIIGGVVLGGMVPPLLHANDMPEEAVRKLTENLFQIRIGGILRGWTVHGKSTRTGPAQAAAAAARVPKRAWRSGSDRTRGLPRRADH